MNLFENEFLAITISSGDVTEVLSTHNLIRSGLLKNEAEPDWSGQWSEPWAPGGSLGKTVIPKICVFIEVLGSFGKLCTTITVAQ